MKLFSTSCETLYLGWDRPLLPQAVSLLHDRFSVDGRWDLSAWICVLPSTSAVRRFSELLQSADEAVALQPPRVITVGQLPELLYRGSGRQAIDFEQTLAWATVLRQVPPEDLAPLMPDPPEPEALVPWLELAGTLRRLHEELAADHLTFAEVIDFSETDAEKRRWKLLATLFADYEDVIAQAGLVDAHVARRDAVERGRCRTDKKIALIGTSDLSKAIVAMLRSLDSDLMSLVAAPPSAAHRFDEFGCVETDSWTEHQLPLRDSQLIAAGDVSDQAAAVAESLADFASSHSADEITIGITDASQIGPLEVQLRGCGVKTFRHLGWTVAETAIGRLFKLMETHLHRQSWESLAALARHADVCDRITRDLQSAGLAIGDETDWLGQLDQLRGEHYPRQLRQPLPKGAASLTLATAVAEWVEGWLADFRGPTRPLAEWSRLLDSWLIDLYGDQGQNATQWGRTRAAVTALQRLLGRFAELNSSLDVAVSGAAAVAALASRFADLRVFAESADDQVELVGWLDLSLNDAAAMVVTGLNHPFVPAATTSDPFLPGTLRSRLRMADNDRRFARDVYAMHLMLSTRKEIRFIAGKSAADRSPTPPSRLLTAASDVDIARRIRQLLAEIRDAQPVEHEWDRGHETCLPVPVLTSAADAEISSLSVTAFRDYLACPYRFYLRHVLKLRPLDDAANELAANQFGDLVHAALERFGQSDQRHESDSSRIESSLLEHLQDYFDEHYGENVSTAVHVQLAQARRRIAFVANEQARRVAAGWQIHASEASVGPEQGAGIEIDGEWMGLKGRFDRIDRHADGRWAILDYKTHGHRPERKHLRRTPHGEEWIDLQLPLYRFMVPFLGIEADPEDVELGYFNVAEKESDTRINIAEFSPAQLRQAEERVYECIRGIRRGDFSPSQDRIPFDDYGAILQTGVASRLLDQSELALQEVGE